MEVSIADCKLQIYKSISMVCPLGSGRMAVMARLLAAAGNVSQKIAEEVGHQKFVAQMICKELSEANEANWIDEEDMHMFGLKPMDDPLDLVCCNACKKPVMASQYATHAGLCRSLNPMQETNLELDGSMGQRKPPRKERKKLITAYANQSISVGDVEGSESVDVDDIAVPQPQLDGQIGRNPCSFMEAKRNSAYVDVTTYMMDVPGVNPVNTNGSTCVMLPPTKRFKMVAGEQLPLTDDLGIASAVSKLTSTQNAYSYRDSPKGAISASEIPNVTALKCKMSGQALECCRSIKDGPLPLATKVYYSQKSNRLRSALCHLYDEAVASKELFSDMSGAESLPSLRKPDQILAQNSEVCLGKSIVCLPDSDFSNQLSVDNVARPQAAGVGLTRSKILSKPYSFVGSSGQSLGTMQQQTGSVPVI